MSSTNVLEIVLNNAPKFALVNAIETHYLLNIQPGCFSRYGVSDLKSFSKEFLIEIIIREEIDFNRFETNRQAEMKQKKQFEKECFKVVEKEVERRFNKKCDEITKLNETKRNEEHEVLYREEIDREIKLAEKLGLKIEMVKVEGFYYPKVDNYLNCGNKNLKEFQMEKRKIITEYHRYHRLIDDKYFKALNKEAMLSIDVLKIQMEVQQEYDSKTGAFEAKECPCCYELTNKKINGCFHHLCQSCFDRLPIKKCPLCRNYCELI